MKFEKFVKNCTPFRLSIYKRFIENLAYKVLLLGEKLEQRKFLFMCYLEYTVAYFCLEGIPKPKKHYLP
jgi:hypothetical protein